MDKEQKEFIEALLYSSVQLQSIEQVRENISKFNSASDEEKEGHFTRYSINILRIREKELMKLGKVIPAKYKEYDIGVYENTVNGMYQVENNHKYGYRKEGFSFPDNVPKYISKRECIILAS